MSRVPLAIALVVTLGACSIVAGVSRDVYELPDGAPVDVVVVVPPADADVPDGDVESGLPDGAVDAEDAGLDAPLG